jgi:hypothetical protein
MSRGANIVKAVRRAGKRIAGARLDPFLVARVRFIVFIGALLALTLAFMVHDDWFVRNFATYDWARDLGF